MSRLVPYINKPSDEVLRLLDETVDITLYLLQETGPTSFILKDEEGHKFKIQIGSMLSCSCGGGSKKKKHCVHLLFALMKIFRLEVTNPLIWQLSFVDHEVNRIIQSRFEVAARPKPKIKRKKEAKEEDFVQRLSLEDEGPCAICFEDMGPDERLTYCRTGCGHNIHAYCMKMWANQKESQRVAITCPLCRQDWGPKALEYIRKDSQRLKDSNAYKETTHVGHTCRGCKKDPIRGKLYHCLCCQDYELCSFCFDQAKHIAHPFIVKETISSEWEVAKRHGQGNGQTRQMMMDSLQNREISPLDYDLLLGLDGRNDPTPVTLESYFVSNLTVYQQESPFATNKICCCVCDQEADSERWRQLPCAHYVHHRCAFRLFEGENANKCPRDHQVVFPGYASALAPRKAVPKKGAKKSQKKSDLHQLASQVGSLALSVEGTHLRENFSNRTNQEEFKVQSGGRGVAGSTLSSFSSSSALGGGTPSASAGIDSSELYRPNFSVGGSAISLSSASRASASSSRNGKRSNSRTDRRGTIRSSARNILTSSGNRQTSNNNMNSMEVTGSSHQRGVAGAGSNHVNFGGAPGDMRAQRRLDPRVEQLFARAKPPTGGAGRFANRRAHQAGGSSNNNENSNAAVGNQQQHVANMNEIQGLLQTNSLRR